MVQLLGWLMLLVALSIGVVWMTEHPGIIAIDWMGYRIETPIGILIAAAVLALIALAPVFMLLRKLFALPNRYRMHSEQQRYHKGLDELTGAITALAADDLSRAEGHTRKAERLIGKTPLTSLLGAQISYKQQDISGTREQLTHMLEHDQTHFIAARALSSLARNDGDLDAAIAHAKDALAQKPKSDWAARTLVELYLQKKAWQQAEQVVKSERRSRRMDRATGDHLLALLFYLQAANARESGQTETALRTVLLAHKHDPSFIPATLLGASLASESGSKRKAIGIIQRSWKAVAHPELSKRLLEISEDDSSSRIMKRFRSLAAVHPSHVESQLALAQAALHTKQWDTARSHLKAALGLAKTPRAYKLLAELERLESHNEKAAGEWLSKASEVMADNVWLCDQCGHQQRKWSLHCDHCEGFDTIVWQPPHEPYHATHPSLLLASA